jgi:hypothetical protein
MQAMPTPSAYLVVLLLLYRGMRAWFRLMYGIVAFSSFLFTVAGTLATTAFYNGSSYLLITTNIPLLVLLFHEKRVYVDCRCWFPVLLQTLPW